MLNHFTTSPRGRRILPQASSRACGRADDLVAPRGFEPRLTDSKSAVLPLDEGATAVRVRRQRNGAEDGTRTRDPHLGKVMLYQLSHFRSGAAHAGDVGAESQSRTGDTAIFSRVLYQLSYLGPARPPSRSNPTASRRIARAPCPPQSRPTVSTGLPRNAANRSMTRRKAARSAFSRPTRRSIATLVAVRSSRRR